MPKFFRSIIQHFPNVLQAFDRQTEFSLVFDFTILSYSQNLQKFLHIKGCAFQY